MAVLLLARQPQTLPSAPASTALPASRPGYRLPNNQTYFYQADWRFLTAGTATLHMDQADREERITGTADATGAIALIYHVHDRFESFFEPESYCSLSLAKQTEEGFRRVNTNIRFDYINHKSILEEKNLKNNQSKQQANDIPSCVTDVLSAIYYVGSLPLAPNASYSFPLNDGGRTALVNAQVEGKEEVKTPAGSFQTIRVQPSSDTGTLKSKGKIWVWYSDDERRIPVQMRARMFWGTLNVQLARVENK